LLSEQQEKKTYDLITAALIAVEMTRLEGQITGTKVMSLMKSKNIGQGIPISFRNMMAL